MPPDDARLQDARVWLVKAELDLKAAAHEMTAPAEALWGDVMFHAQQAAEKCMKAFLAWHDVPFRKTHILEELGQQCVLVDAMLAHPQNRLRGLLFVSLVVPPRLRPMQTILSASCPMLLAA